MNVPSFAFLAFAAIAAAAINASSKPAWRRAVLLVVNLAFVASFTTSPSELAPFVGLLGIGFAFVKVLEVWKNRIAFVVGVVVVVALYCWLKHYAFIPPALLLKSTYFTVGMSYVFFRIVHLVVDAFQDSLPNRIGLVSYINYTLNFTALVSGPIQMYRDYVRTETQTPADLASASVGRALERIIEGFFKVALLSPILAAANAASLASLNAAAGPVQRVFFCALMMTLYPIYLYVNFSGYTDFVIGVARFLRLELPENFNKPFMATGFMELWGRWHMSLSNWFKTYMYSTLLIALMRRFPSRKVEPYLGVITFFVTFFLVGVWHGQTTEFLFCGVLLGLGVSLNKLYQIVLMRRLGRVRYRALTANVLYASASRGVNFVYFSFTLLWFWSSWSQLGHFASELGPLLTLSVGLVAIVVASAVLALLKLGGDTAAAKLSTVLPSPYLRTAWSTMLAVITISATAVLNAPAPHIVYRGF